jgi:AcrR family transcriptional regulator
LISIKEDRNKEKDLLQKTQILAAAKTVFIKHGYTKASMDDIARLAAKSRTTLYKYYKNKDQVLEDFIVFELAEIVNVAADAIGDAPSLEIKLRNYNFKKLAAIRDKIALCQHVVNDISENPAHFIFFKDQFSRLEKVVMKKIFLESIDHMEIKPIEPAKLDFLISVITLALRGIEYEAFMSGAEDDLMLEQKLEWLIGILVQGLK